jgi:hypothetical protein
MRQCLVGGDGGPIEMRHPREPTSAGSRICPPISQEYICFSRALEDMPALHFGGQNQRFIAPELRF